MKAKIILDAILAMKDTDRLGFMTPPETFAHTMNRLASARMELEIELGRIGITVEQEEKTK